MNTTSETETYRCDKCKDLEYITKIVDGQEVMVECTCKAERDHERALAHSGIFKKFKSKGFKNFEENELNFEMKKACLNYLKSKAYQEGQSIMLLGQVGSGKTHLGMAIANNLLASGVFVKYIDYRQFITLIKQAVTDGERYQGMIEVAKRADVLFLDDLFKGEPTKADLKVLFEIVNARYLADLPMIVTSEILPSDMIGLDEGLVSRLMQMAENYTVVSKAKNKRLEHWRKNSINKN